MVYLDATLIPHRALTPWQFRLLMGAFLACLGLIGGLFFWLGAWPVLGFCGAEILLIYYCLRRNFRTARAREHIRLSDQDGLEILREDQFGSRSYDKVEPTWAQVVLEELAYPVGRLALRSHGRDYVIGQFLPPEERQSFADKLQVALTQYRSARYQ